MPSDDSWDFKVKPKNKPSRPKKNTAKVGREIKKRRLNEAEAEKKGASITLGDSRAGARKSRSQLAKEYEREEDKKREPHPDEIYGSFFRRVFATLVDLLLSVFSVMLFLTYKAELWIDIEMGIFGVEDYGQGPLITYFGSLGLLTYFLISVVPTIVFGRSLGKSFAAIRLCGVEGQHLGFLKTFLREVCLKPIACLSVVGVLICFLSKKRKMLHDHLIGSIVERY